MSDYRDAPPTCPACRTPMEPRVLSESTVDTCPQCRGLWVDWFDGELVAVVQETAPLSFRSAVAPPRDAACPRCARPLASEAFAQSVALLRCADCGGCFVPRASFNALLDLDLAAHAREDAEPARRHALARLILAIQRLFGAEPTVKTNALE